MPSLFQRRPMLLCSSTRCFTCFYSLQLEVSGVYSSSRQIFNDQLLFKYFVFFLTLSPPEKKSVKFYIYDICPSFPVLFFLLHWLNFPPGNAQTHPNFNLCSIPNILPDWGVRQRAASQRNKTQRQPEQEEYKTSFLPASPSVPISHSHYHPNLRGRLLHPA